MSSTSSTSEMARQGTPDDSGAVKELRERVSKAEGDRDQALSDMKKIRNQLEIL
jgi:hypothetical protein